MIQRIKRLGRAIVSLWRLVFQNEDMTYFPESERKDRIAILGDLLRWMAVHKEINHFYYYYGLDRKRPFDINKYLGKKEVTWYLGKTNLHKTIGDRTTSYICMSYDKFIFGRYLTQLGYPTPKVIGLCDNQFVTWLDSEEHSRPQPLASILTREGLDVFVKEILGECGDGVYHVRVRNGRLEVSGRKLPIEEFSFLLNGKFILQERFIQHPEISRYYPHSVNTLRLVTAMGKDGPVLLGSFMRMGVNGSICDNVSAGGLCISIDVDSGKLLKYGRYAPAFGRKTDVHPDTGLRFEGFEIPFFKQTREMALSLHEFFYGLHSIAWDIGIAETGPSFIEANSMWAFVYMQADQQDGRDLYLSTLPAGMKKF